MVSLGSSDELLRCQHAGAACPTDADWTGPAVSEQDHLRRGTADLR